MNNEKIKKWMYFTESHVILTPFTYGSGYHIK